MRLDNISEKEKRIKIVESLDKNMFVEAGAGAGKTTIIVKRIINQLMNGIRPGEIVAITFTNAATRELKSRILNDALRIANDKNSNYAKQSLENLKNSLDELDQMQISTIHSFCYRILSEKMFEAALPYGFTLAEENDMDDLRSRYFKLWAESLGKSDWEKLLPTGKYRRGVVDRIMGLASQLDSVPEDYEIKVALPDMSEAEAVKTLTPIIKKISDETVALVNMAYGTFYSSFDQIGDLDLTSYGKKLRDAIASGDILVISKAILPLPATKSFIVKAVTKDSMESIRIFDKKDQKAFKAKVLEEDNKIRDYLESVSGDIERVRVCYSNSLFRPYIGYAKEALEYINNRISSGVISNDKLLEKTKELVEASDDVRRYFAKKFRAIYVDEFQDTDHLQESFIRLLASDPTSPDKLRDGALFVVGDPKQSIYRFRGAEPEVYFSTKGWMQNLDNACVVELSDNYRSNERIIEWVNSVFSKKNITIGQSYIPMNTGNPLPAAGLPQNLFAGVYRSESPEIALSADDIESDRQAVCKLIKSLMDNKYLIADRDNNRNVFYREIKYSDFLVLCMNTPGMSDYEECFHRYGIPVIMDSKSDVSCDHDLHMFIRFYEYLTSPMDVAAKIGALEALDISGASDRLCNEKILEQIYKETENLSAYGCVKYLLNNPALYLYKDIEIQDYEIKDLQKKIIQMTESIQAQTFGNRAALLQEMKEYCSKNVEHELLLKRDIDAVRFMNLHKAKGLEGNIVIWTNRTENRIFRAGSYRYGHTFYPSIGYVFNNRRITEWTAYDGDQKLIDKAKAEDDSEAIRLEYVAATRAKQAIVFMDRYNKSDGNLFSVGYDLGALNSVETIISEYKENPESPEIADFDISARTIYKRKTESDIEYRKPVYSSESPSDYENNDAGRIKTDDSSKLEHKRPTGNIFGTVMHRAFELVVNRRNVDSKKIDIPSIDFVQSCIRQAVNESIDDIPEKDISLYEEFLKDAVMAFGIWFWHTDIKKNADAIYTELPFSYMKNTDDETKSPVWMHGEADLVARLKDGSFYILDYKSDSDEKYPDEKTFEERLRGKYTPQINAYREAVCRVFKTKPQNVKAALISFSQKKVKKNEKLRLRVTVI